VSSLAELDEALAAFGVHAGFPEKRRGLAGLLLADGLGAEDVELLGRHCEATVVTRDGLPREASVVRVLVSILACPADAKARTADLRACAAATAQRNEPEFGKSLRQQPSDEDLAQRTAFARVIADRAPVDRVAAEMGTTPTKVERLVAAERDLRARQRTEPQRIRSESAADVQRRRAEIQSELFNRKRLPQTKGENRVLEVLRKQALASSWIFDEIAATKHVDLRRMLKDPVRRGAFAELENSGMIQPLGDPDLSTGLQPFRVVHDKAQQQAIREARRNWMAAELETMRTRPQVAGGES